MQCAIEEETDNDKYKTIRSIISENVEVKHLIIRHGLDEKQAFEIESTIIDLLDYLSFEIANKVLGHHANENGIMTTDEVIRLYNPEPLTKIEDSVICININKQYKRGFSVEDIYNATKDYWKIAKSKVSSLVLTIELNPEKEAKLRKRAEEIGFSIDEYIEKLILEDSSENDDASEISEVKKFQ